MQRGNKPYLTASTASSGDLFELARQNRKLPTEAEDVMWQMLRRHFYGIKFRRQHVVGQYIADFICLSKRFVIEIDGGYHQTKEQQLLDKERTLYLNAVGLTVLRFTNEEVLSESETVLQKIKTYITKELII